VDPRSNAELFIVRDANGHTLSYLRREGAERGDDGDLSADEVGQQLRQAIVFAFQLVVLDRHVFALDVAGFAEAFLETADPTCAALGRTLSDKPDHHSWQCALSHEQSLQKRLLRLMRPHFHRAASFQNSAARLIATQKRSPDLWGVEAEVASLRKMVAPTLPLIRARRKERERSAPAVRLPDSRSPQKRAPTPFRGLSRLKFFAPLAAL
jgi:hypothetical protein